MDEYKKIIDMTDGEDVRLTAEFKNLLGKEFVLGQTRYVWRNGTLSDGHEKITPAQRFYQATKEMWHLGGAIRQSRASAMLSQADLLDAETDLSRAVSAADRLRAEAKILQAKERIVNCLVAVEDAKRGLDECNKVRLELRASVMKQYPEGIEQAEPDNWRAVAQYKIAKANMGSPEHLTHIPLEQSEKAKLGLETNRPELAFWLAVDKGLSTQDKQGLVKFLESKEQ